MGAYSEIDIDLKYGDGTEQSVEAFSLGPEEKELGQEQIRFEDEDAQRAEADAAPQELKKLMGEEKPPKQDTAPAVPSVTDEAEAEARRAHEEAEAKRKAEWEAQREARKAAEEKQFQKVAAMGEEELLMASAKRINAETERLTRRNMKEYLAEYLQTLCLDDLEFARLTMHPRKSFMHCIWYINRKAREYLEQEMKDNGMQRPYGVNGMYGGDVPDDVVYQWAEDYYRDMSAEEDKEPEEEFVPKPYTGPVSTKGKKRNSAKKKEKTPAAEKTAAQKLASEAPEEEQISFGAFLQDMEKAS